LRVLRQSLEVHHVSNLIQKGVDNLSLGANIAFIQLLPTVLSATLPETRPEFRDAVEGPENASIPGISLGPFLEVGISGVLYAIAEDPRLFLNDFFEEWHVSLHLPCSLVDTDGEEMSNSRECSAICR
jgi:hypothetical protein